MSEEIEIETGDAPVVEDFTPELMAVDTSAVEVALQKVSALGKTIELDLGAILDGAVARLDALKANLGATLARYQSEADAILEEAARDINSIGPRIDDLRAKARRARSGEV